MEQIELIIFDFDGVLRSASWEGVYHGYKKLIEAVGKNSEHFFTDLDSFKKWHDPDWHKNESRILGGEYVPNKVLNEIFHTAHDPYSKLFPWVSETIDCLAKKYKLAILSSSARTSVKKELCDLSRYFSFIVGGEEVTHLKPDPEGVLFILKEINVFAENTIIIGDMEVDFLAGKRAGIKTGVVKWGMGDWNKLSSLKPDFLFEKPEELLLKL